MKPPILSVENLKVWYKVYSGYLQVVEGVTLTVAHGERVGLVGETGCGKTTTMKAIMQLLPYQGHIPQGRIVFEDRDILNMKPNDIQKLRTQGIGMIFQDPTAALNPVFTIGNQIYDVIRDSEKKSKSRKEIHEEAIAILDKVALPDAKRILTNYPFQLSGGMRQRICIALALSSAGKLLIADEPTTSLDVTIQAQILDLVRNVVSDKNTSLVLITHNLGVAKEMTDRIYVMYAGTIIEVADTEVLFENPRHPYTQGLFISVPRLTGGGFADGIPGRIPNYLKPPKGCRFQPRCPKSMDICLIEKPLLYPISRHHQVACFIYEDSGDSQQ